MPSRCSKGRRLLTAARLAGVGSEQASAFGEQLVRAGILRDVRPLEFEHVLVRDAVLSGPDGGRAPGRAFQHFS